MKLGTRKISLMVATVMFAFSGIFGLAQAGADGPFVTGFEQVVIKNNIKYAIKLDIKDYNVDSGWTTTIENVSLKAGESKVISEKGELFYSSSSEIKITPMEENKNLCFHQSRFSFDEGSTFIQVNVTENDEWLGLFFVIVRLADNTLYVTIDSIDLPGY